ncbi:MAG: MFS transporter [Parcubacteria group bacterium]
MKRFIPVYLGIFFLSLHFATFLYINSSFLETFFTSSTVGLLFILGASLNMVFFIYSPRMLSFFGAKKLFYIFLLLEGLAVSILISADSALSAVVGFTLVSSVSLIITYLLDIFLEELSSDDHTGEIRGSYLTVMNLGIAMAPMFVAFLLVNNDFSLVYKASFIFLLPLFIIGVFLAHRVEERPHHTPRILPWLKWWQSENVRRITLARFILEFFFTVMMIYSPIYLHSILGFEWQAIGVMLSIVLLPFVLFQWPVGELADHFFGEKEFLLTGIALMVFSLLLMPFLSPVFWIWTLVLFVGRTGGSFLEITTESYFFKQVTSEDTGLVSIFRLTRPVSIILGAGLGSLSVKFLPLSAVFIMTALVLTWGFIEVSRLKDTRQFVQKDGSETMKSGASVVSE